MAINEYGQGGGGGASTFDDLTDTPAMSGQAGKIVKINSTEDGVVYESGGAGAGGWDDSASGTVVLDTPSDKVGLGIAVPLVQLHIQSAGDAGIQIDADDDDSGENDNPLIKMTQDNGSQVHSLGLVGVADQVYADSLANAGYVHAGNFQVATAGTAAITVDSSQNVGLGRNAPGSRLEIDGSLQFYTGAALAGKIAPMGPGDMRTQDSAGYSHIRMNTAGVVLNDGKSAAFDLRVKGDTEDHLLFVDSGAERVGVLNSSPTTELDVTGTVKATAFQGDGSALTGVGGSSGWTDTGTTIHPTETTDRVLMGTSTADTSTGAIVTADGAQSFKAISTPGDATGYAKIFAKDVVATAAAAEVLYHFDDNVEDASTNENDGAATGVTYATSGAGGASASGFDKAAVFDGSDYVLIDDIDIGTSDMTCEFWVNFDAVSTSATDNNCIVSEGQSTASSTAGAGYFAIIVSSGVLKAFYWDGSGPVSDDFTMSGTFVANTWYHVAYVRSSTAHSLYVGTAGSASGTRVATWTHTAYAVGGAGDDWQIGRMRDGTYSAYNLNGELDELLISKEARYSGTTYTLPTEPYSGTSTTTTHIYVRDSAGVETKLT